MKVSIIGAGHVGSSIAYALIMREFARHIVLIDRSDEIMIARELELNQSIAALNANVSLKCSTDYFQTENSDVVIFAAGLARKEGQTRNELLKANTDIMLDCANKIKRYTKSPLFIVLTNPVDFLLNALYEANIFESKKIVAMAGILDNARFKYELAKKLNSKIANIDTRLIGFHNDDMVLIKSYSSVNNEPITKLLSENELDEIENEVKIGGAKVIRHLKSSAYLAPAAACVRMLESMRTGEFLPMSVILHGEYGVNGKALGVMARLGLNGVIEIMSLNLDKDEQEKLEKSLIKYQYKGE